MCRMFLSMCRMFLSVCRMFLSMCRMFLSMCRMFLSVCRMFLSMCRMFLSMCFMFLSMCFMFLSICRMFLSMFSKFLPPWTFLFLLYFLHNRSDGSAPFFSTTFQNFQSIFYLLSQELSFQHHKQLCSKCSGSLVCSLELSPICWWTDCYWMLLLS